MTEEEALQELTRRACNRNLYIAITGHTSTPMIATDSELEDGIDGLVNIQMVLGGSIVMGSRSIIHRTSWKIGEDRAVEILEKIEPYLKTAAKKSAYACIKLDYLRRSLKHWQASRG